MTQHIATTTKRLIPAFAALLMTACASEEVQAQATPSTMEINITIGSHTFVAEIEDTQTGRAFVSRLPMTLNMSELNGNEKYYYLDESLPTAAQHYGTIHAGDLMLYGNSCVVLFYGQAGGYSYTRLGKLKSTEGLTAAVGSGDVAVTFSAATSGIDALEHESPSEGLSPNGEGSVYSISGTKLKQEPTRGVYVKRPAEGRSQGNKGKKYIK